MREIPIRVEDVTPKLVISLVQDSRGYWFASVETRLERGRTISNTGTWTTVGEVLREVDMMWRISND